MSVIFSQPPVITNLLELTAEQKIFDDIHLQSSYRGRCNRENGHHETWQCGIRSNRCVRARLNRGGPEQKCSRKYSSWWHNLHLRVRWRTLRTRQRRDFNISTPTLA